MPQSPAKCYNNYAIPCSRIDQRYSAIPAIQTEHLEKILANIQKNS